MSSTGKPTIIPDFELNAEGAEPSLLARIGRKGLLKQLTGLRDGELRLVDLDGTQHRFGARTARCALSVTLHVLNPQFFADTAFGGTPRSDGTAFDGLCPAGKVATGFMGRSGALIDQLTLRCQ